MARWKEKDIPFKLRIQMKFADQPARSTKGLTEQCLSYLREAGFRAWENKTVGVFDTNEATKKLVPKVKWMIKGGKIPSGLYGIIQGILKKCYRKTSRKGDHVGLIKKGIIEKGMADIEAVHMGSGIFLAVEVKHGKDKMAPHQLAYKEIILDAGAGYIEVKVLADLIKYVENFKPFKCYENKTQDNGDSDGGAGEKVQTVGLGSGLPGSSG